MAGIRFGLDSLWPPLCLACQAPLQPTPPKQHILAEDALGCLCPSCFASLRLIRPPVCLCCGSPLLVAGLGHQYCGSCSDFALGRSVQHTRAVGLYEGALVALILAFKHGDRLDLAPRLAQWMNSSGADILPQADLLVPIPLHWRRLMQRRFNQSAILAHAVSKSCGTPYMGHALKRQHFAHSQRDQSAEQRYLNLADAFCVPDKAKPQIQGKRVVLIDDVRTTGATLSSAGQALLDGGAKAVDALVLALVPSPHADYVEETQDQLLED